MKTQPTELPPNHFANLFSHDGKPSSLIALHLLKQIEQDNESCARWMVSAISKLASENPGMTIEELLLVLEEAIPETVASYKSWLHDT